MFVKRLIILIVLSVASEPIESSNLSIKRVRRDNGNCGIPLESTGLIYGGNSFHRGAWPWMVAIFTKKTSPPTFNCGGVLVSSTKVLTGELEMPENILNAFLRKSGSFFKHLLNLNIFFEYNFLNSFCLPKNYLFRLLNKKKTSFS